MTKTITLTEEEARDALDANDTINTDSDTSYRHGSYETYVISQNGKHYESTFSCHHSEGIEIWGETTWYEVVEKQVTKTEWVKA